MAITRLDFYLRHTPFKKKIIDGQVGESGESLSNRRYLIPSIEHTRWYVTPIEGNIKNYYIADNSYL